MANTFPRFQLDDLNEDPTPALEEVKELILDLILVWPNLEYGLTCWIAFAKGVPVSQAAKELGTRSNRDRIRELNKLYAQMNDAEAAALLLNIGEEHESFVHVRNTVAHALLVGTSKSKPQTAYFLTTRAVPEEHGFMEIRGLAFSSFKEAREFAIGRAANIRDLLRARGVEVD